MWQYFVEGAFTTEQLFARFSECLAPYSQLPFESRRLIARVVLKWINEYEELRDCIAQEVTAVDREKRVAEFKEAFLTWQFLLDAQSLTLERFNIGETAKHFLLDFN